MASPSEKTNRQWVLRQRPKGLIQPGDLELVETPVPNLAESEVLVRTVYLSLDPTNRTWMNDTEGYLPPVVSSPPDSSWAPVEDQMAWNT